MALTADVVPCIASPVKRAITTAQLDDLLPLAGAWQVFEPHKEKPASILSVLSIHSGQCWANLFAMTITCVTDFYYQSS